MDRSVLISGMLHHDLSIYMTRQPFPSIALRGNHSERRWIHNLSVLHRCMLKSAMLDHDLVTQSRHPSSPHVHCDEAPPTGDGSSSSVVPEVSSPYRRRRLKQENLALPQLELTRTATVVVLMP